MVKLDHRQRHEKVQTKIISISNKKRSKELWEVILKRGGELWAIKAFNQTMGYIGIMVYILMFVLFLIFVSSSYRDCLFFSYCLLAPLLRESLFSALFILRAP